MIFNLDPNTATFNQLDNWYKENKDLIPNYLMLHGEHVTWQQPRMRFNVELRWIKYEASITNPSELSKNPTAQKHKANLIMLYKDLKHYHENLHLVKTLSVRLKEVVVFDPMNEN